MPWKVPSKKRLSNEIAKRTLQLMGREIIVAITEGKLDFGQGHQRASQRVAAAVIQRDDRFLLCQRSRHKRHGGLWEFPGGKGSPEESLCETLQRELAEELGVVVLICHDPLLQVPDSGSSFVVEFVPVEITGRPSQREHQALAWVTAPELLSYPLAPADQVFAQQLPTLY